MERKESHLVMDNYNGFSDLSQLIPAHIRKIKFRKQPGFAGGFSRI